MIDQLMHEYRYMILRYIHDRRTEEFVNIGIVLECPSKGYLGSRFDTSFQRVSNFFPGSSANFIKKFVTSLGGSIASISHKLKKSGDDLFHKDRSYFSLVWSQALSKDDTAISWSSIRGGITHDPERELNRIFERSVLKYKNPQERQSKSDADVWKSVERHLEHFSLDSMITNHRVKSSVSEYNFEHCLRNGKWHCIEPISMDLVKEESIRSKAQKIFGGISLIRSAATNHKIYFVLSDPSSKASKDMFQEAHSIIDSIEMEHEIVMESQSFEMAERINSIFH